MSSTSLFRRWKLTSAPFECRPSILEEIRIEFRGDGSLSIDDTANSSYGTYEVIPETDTSATIEIKGGGWTELARFWETNKENKEASLADEFIHQLIKEPFELELRDDKLIISYQGNEYKFSPV